MWQRNPSSNQIKSTTPFFVCSEKLEDPEDGTDACGSSRFKIRKFPDGIVAECAECNAQYPLKDVVNGA